MAEARFLHQIDSLRPEKTAVLVIDMQNDFVAENAPIFSEMGNRILEPMAAFLDLCREKGIRVAYTADHKFPGETTFLQEGTRGVEVHPAVRPKAGELVIKKYRFSGFFDTQLDVLLRHVGVDTVAIIGVCTDVCCFSTARDAMFLGYRVAFLSDLTGTFPFPDRGYGPGDAQEQHDWALRNIAFSTGHVMTSAEFLALPTSD